MRLELLQQEKRNEAETDVYDIYNQFKDDEPFYTGACLAGLDTGEAWKIRKYLLAQKRGVEGRRGVAQGLAGLSSVASFELRLQLMEVAPECVARSLSGDDSPEAWQIRDELAARYLNQPGVAEGLAESLANIDNERAWVLREKLIPLAIYNIFEGLVGVDSERAWELRNKYKEEMPLAVAGSLIGIDSERADKLRVELGNHQAGGKVALLISCIGRNDNRTWDLRKELMPENPFIVGTSLVGLKNERADKYRKILLDKIKKLEARDEDNSSTVTKMRKGLLQGLNSNYIFEALKKRK